MPARVPVLSARPRRRRLHIHRRQPSFTARLEWRRSYSRPATTTTSHVNNNRRQQSFQSENQQHVVHPVGSSAVSLGPDIPKCARLLRPPVPAHPPTGPGRISSRNRVPTAERQCPSVARERLVPRGPQLATESGGPERHRARYVSHPRLVRSKVPVRVKCPNGTRTDVGTVTLCERQVSTGLGTVSGTVNATVQLCTGPVCVLREVQCAQLYAATELCEWRTSMGGLERLFVQQDSAETAAAAC